MNCNKCHANFDYVCIVHYIDDMLLSLNSKSKHNIKELLYLRIEVN